MTETIDMTRAVRARNALFAVFAANGFALASWMARVPDVKDLLQLTPGQLSVLLLSISVGALVGLPAAGRISSRIGAKNTVRLALAILVPAATQPAMAAPPQ
mgnify:CR=1 FL=1